MEEKVKACEELKRVFFSVADLFVFEGSSCFFVMAIEITWRLNSYATSVI